MAYINHYYFLMNWNVGRMLCLARRYDDALTELRRAGDMQRNSAPVDIWIFKSHWMKGQVDEAIAADVRLRGYRDELSTQSLNALRAAYANYGSRVLLDETKGIVAAEIPHESDRLVSPC